MPVKIPGICNAIRKAIQQYPNEKPKKIALLLYTQYLANEQFWFSSFKAFYLRYRALIYTEKWNYRKWLKTEVKDRLPKPLEHRVEWSLTYPLPFHVLEKINQVAKRVKNARSKKPFGEWYVAPNRNRMRVYNDGVISIRVFPKSLTVRILPARRMTFNTLKNAVEAAFFKANITLQDCEGISALLEPSSRHRTFRIGHVEPFKVDFYQRSLGLIIKSDLSHSHHLEIEENSPAWVKVLVESNLAYARNIQKHLEVLATIGDSARKIEKAVERLVEVLNNATNV